MVRGRGDVGLSGQGSKVQRVIGIDWATKAANVGLCLAERRGQTLKTQKLLLGSECSSPVSQIREWVEEFEGQVLLALDAPLGWPRPMGSILHQHQAGQGIGVEANRFFRRTTDTFVWKQLGKLPLEVGADRIARAALSGLDMLAELRALTGEAIPTAWAPEEPSRVRVIEVYPAATLLGRGIGIRGYKRDSEEGRTRRFDISRELEGSLGLQAEHHQRSRMVDHLLDAAVCVLAGHLFLQGACVPPVNLAEAKVEGWIWFSESEG